LKETRSNQKVEELLEAVNRRARNLYVTHQLFCSEAILVTLNHGFGGGLSEDMAIRLASTLPEGLGGSGCLCGALSGGVLALGLFLGRDRLGGKDKNNALLASKTLHDLFKERYGSICCRVLSKKVKQDPKAHFRQCADLTAVGAELAARLILERRPELVEQADLGYLNRKDSKIVSGFKRVARRLHLFLIKSSFS
jgi:C_GCAxxG_C_C family probable redox protein